MLPSYLQPTENIKAKVRSRSLLKSQIPRAEKKNRDNQSTGRHLRSKFKGGFEVFDEISCASTSESGRFSDSSRFRLYQGDRDLGKTALPSSLKIIKKRATLSLHPQNV